VGGEYNKLLFVIGSSLICHGSGGRSQQVFMALDGNLRNSMGTCKMI
jgi:hypothetical protein